MSMIEHWRTRAEDAEAQVEAVRELAEATIAVADPLGTTPRAATAEVQRGREIAAQVARGFLAAMDPPHVEPAAIVECVACGKRIEVFERDRIIPVAEALSNHLIVCPGGTS